MTEETESTFTAMVVKVENGRITLDNINGLTTQNPIAPWVEYEPYIGKSATVTISGRVIIGLGS